MPTVEEILKQSGMSAEQITALDKSVVGALTTVVSNANQTLEQAQLAQRAQQQMYETDIVPALNSWGSEKARMEAENAYWKTLADKAKEAGFLPGETPMAPAAAAAVAKGPDGRFVAGGNSVPGSPSFEDLQNQTFTGMATLADIQWEYTSLFGGTLPESPTKLAQEASAQRLPLREYVARKFNFDGKKKEMAEAKQKQHDDAIRKEVAAEKDREYAEQRGNNPNLRIAEASKFSQIDAAVKKGDRVDPIMQSREQRHQATSRAIRAEVNDLAASA